MDPTLYMDAVITPHRSLSRTGYYWFIGVLMAFNVAFASVFLAIGALPVLPFLGLDVMAVVLAFRANYRNGGQAERVQVSAEEVRVLRQMGRKARMVWASPTAFTRVALEWPGEHETRVRLHLSDQALTIGSALSPGERSDFAGALERAILKARAARY